MSNSFSFLFHLLEKEKISIDKSEFEFQIQSHQYYPSLLSIADVLSFFNIDNGVISVVTSDLDLLPDRFVALLKEEEKEPKLYSIEKKGSEYFCFHDKKTIAISKSELESRWAGIVLFVEKPVNKHILKSTKNSLPWALPLFALLLLVLVIVSFQTALGTKLFMIFPFFGLLCSVAALKDLFDTKSELLNSLCNMTASTTCNGIINSKKWNFFEIVNLSDLCIVFFGFQFMALFLAILTNNTDSFFTIQKILHVFAVPVIFASLYFQKFVEKKWCPICLVIIAIVVSELLFLVFFQPNEFNYSLKALLLFGFSFIAVFYCWSLLKTVLTKQKELKEFQLKGNRFMRNYEVFKNTLLTKTKKELPESPFILGNKESQTEIAIITNPFCGHCKNVHEILDKIAENYREDLKIRIIFKTDIDSDNEDDKTLFRNLYQIYLDRGEKSFEEAMKYWFSIKNTKIFNNRYNSKVDNTKADAVFRLKNDWCLQNGFTYTPAIFINGYEYPKSYERANLEFFINELIEDKF